MTATTTQTGPAGQLPAPAATRLRPPSWRDPRLLAGVLLVLVSVVVGSRVVAAADDTRPYYVADVTLTPGDTVGADDVRVVQVRLPDGQAPYLSAEQPLPEGLVAVRPVSSGELVPTDSLGPARDVSTQPLGVPVEGALPTGLVEGARVDVWVAAPDPDRAGSFTEPERVVDAAVVSEISSDAGALGRSGATTVQVLLDGDALRTVLGALANGADVSLVLVPGGGS